MSMVPPESAPIPEVPLDLVPPRRSRLRTGWTRAARALLEVVLEARCRRWLGVGCAGIFLVLALTPVNALWTANEASILLNRHETGGDAESLRRALVLLEERAGKADSLWNGGRKDHGFWRTYGAAASRQPSDGGFTRLIEARDQGRLDRIGLLWLGEIASSLGHWREAREAYVRMDSTNLLIQRGADAAATGERDQARNWYALAVATVEAAARREGLPRSSLGQLELTAPHEADILAAPGGRAISLLRIGRGFLGLGYPEEAIPILEQALSEMRVDPPGVLERQSIQLSLAAALTGVRPPDRPLPRAVRERVGRLVERALSLDRAAPTLLEAGGILRAAGEREQALALYEEAVQRDPHLPEAYLVLGGLFHDRGYLFLARDLYRRAAEKLPGDVRIAGELAKMNYLTHQPEALALLERAVAMGSRDSRLYTYLGDLYLSLARLTDAQRAYREALTLVGKSRSLEERLALVAEARRVGP